MKLKKQLYFLLAHVHVCFIKLITQDSSLSYQIQKEKKGYTLEGTDRNDS